MTFEKHLLTRSAVRPVIRCLPFFMRIRGLIASFAGEHLYGDDGTITVCNEEGKLIGLEGNRRIDGDVLVGTFFVVGDSGEGDYRSLTDEECGRYMERYAEPEEISQEEIDEHTGFTILPADSFNPFEPF